MTDPNDLYGLPLDRFVPERGALAKALRSEGRKDEAARVAALRKPSVAAWTVNQLMRTQRGAVASLFEAGDALGRAQSELLAGRGDAQALREATGSERRAVEELTGVARGLLSTEGHEPTPATLDRVSETLHAAALEEHARAQVRDGCLERELRWVGFGGGGAPATPTPPRGGRRSDSAGAATGGAETKPRAGRARAEQSAREQGERAARDQAEQAQREQAGQAERERTERLKAARKDEGAARRLAERSAREVQAAQERRDRAARSLGEADDALAAARERAEEAALAHQRARQALEGD